ncbi:hypothetical protein CPB86DRAFT_868783 [Serendipita vermifera]|nr:hypothetical protein CPB86DRAFT_868783 [Serendipita vermifera]
MPLVTITPAFSAPILNGVSGFDSTGLAARDVTPSLPIRSPQGDLYCDQVCRDKLAELARKLAAIAQAQKGAKGITGGHKRSIEDDSKVMVRSVDGPRLEAREIEDLIELENKGLFPPIHCDSTCIHNIAEAARKGAIRNAAKTITGGRKRTTDDAELDQFVEELLKLLESEADDSTGLAARAFHLPDSITSCARDPVCRQQIAEAARRAAARNKIKNGIKTITGGRKRTIDDAELDQFFDELFEIIESEADDSE